jgi:hypothetical protein
VCIGKNSLLEFPIQNCLKQEDVLLPLVFNVALEHAIRKDLELNETHQLIVCADNIIYIGQKHKYHKEKHRSSIKSPVRKLV